ncbi:MAG TPA: hypothetical protein VFN42_11400 [Acetobacteraceae bacterium]|nr:hypothetical protein [Acetobacteraceae bacterium]
MRNHGWLAAAILAVSACLCGPVRAAPPTGGSYVTTIPPQVSNPPPLSPAGEQVVPNDPEFSRECLQMIPALRKNIHMERALTTQTRQWGMVMRIDFTMTATQMQTIAGRVNRLVFWRRTGDSPSVLIAVGQPLAPLP